MDGTTTPKDVVAYVDMPWQETRERWIQGEPYWQTYQRFNDRFKTNLLPGGLEVPHTEEAEYFRKKSIDRATPEDLLTYLGQTPLETRSNKTAVSHRLLDASGGKYSIWHGLQKDKLWVTGHNNPEQTDFEDITTRFYLTLDPLRSTDAFFDLVKQLHAQGTLNKMNLCLFVYDLDTPSITRNAVVAYIKNAHQNSVPDEFIKAYKKSKNEHFLSYTLGTKYRATQLMEQLRGFRLPLDENLSVAEMPNSNSFDKTGVDAIRQKLGTTSRSPHQEVINALRNVATDGVLWNPDSEAILQDEMKGKPIAEGTMLHSYRRMSMPPLVQYESRHLTRPGGKLKFEKV